ncbi:MAG TPA: GH25 family lysozyme, partial [Pyrinomonadaceae bacterium]|nr:GH25 family lysozyme [Pyrinomonadaceae bacterium]
MSANPPSRLLGIDVSHYQGGVNWEAVKAAGCAFAFAKATEGAGVTDPFFHANWAGMKAAGLLRGAYHFFRPAQDAAQQAAHFLSTVQLQPGDLPPVLDVETADGVAGADLVGGVQTWLDAVEP